MRAEARAQCMLLLALGLLLVLGACAHRRLVGPPAAYSLDAPSSEARVRMAILRALGTCGYEVLGEEAGTIHARTTRGSASVSVAVRYDTARYAIAYESSVGMGERVDGRGQIHIARGYEAIVEALGTEILSALRTMPQQAPQPTGPADSLGIPDVPPGYAAASVTEPAPATSAGPVVMAPPVTAAPAPALAPSDAERPSDGARRSEPIYELLGVGAVLFGGGWVANWSSTLAMTSSSEMIGLSFVPLAGPFLQLPHLRWAEYGRWTGVWFPAMGVAQIVGLILAIVGQTVQRPVRESSASAELGPTWALTPTFDAQGPGLSLSGSF